MDHHILAHLIIRIDKYQITSMACQKRSKKPTQAKACQNNMYRAKDSETTGRIITQSGKFQQETYETWENINKYIC